MKLWLYLAAAVTLTSAITFGVRSVYLAGRNSLLAEQAAAAQRRLQDATKAEDAARKCFSDPACRMRNDPNRRD